MFNDRRIHFYKKVKQHKAGPSHLNGALLPNCCVRVTTHFVVVGHIYINVGLCVVFDTHTRI